MNSVTKAGMVSVVIMAGLLIASVGAVDFQEKFQVNGVLSNHETYTGYIGVRNTTKSKLFYMLHTPKDNTTTNTLPLIIWIEGRGPGYSGIFTSISTLGPIQITTFDKVTGQATYQERSTNWADTNNLLFIDGPLGAGYSYVDSGDSVRNSVQGAQDLYAFLIRFYQVYPELASNPLWVFGWSYAGHFVPPFANLLLANSSIKFAGVGLASPWVDPINQIDVYDSFVDSTGIGGPILRTKLSELQTNAYMALMNKNYGLAGQIQDTIEETILTANPGMSLYNFRQYSSSRSTVNFGAPAPFNADTDTEVWANTATTKALLNIPASVTFKKYSPIVYANLVNEVMMSYVKYLNNLIGKVPVLLFSGQDDLMTPALGATNFIKKMRLPVNEDITKAKKLLWTIGGQLVGTAKVAGSFYWAIVDDAGHLTPADQPENVRWLVNTFMTAGTNFTQ